MKMSKVKEVMKIITGIGLTDFDKKVFHNVKKCIVKDFLSILNYTKI